MPNIEDIRRFNDMLILVGKEPQVLAERGESIELPAPGNGARTDRRPAEGADLDALISEAAASPEQEPGEAFPWEELGAGAGAVRAEEELPGDAIEAEPTDESPFDFENFSPDDLDIGEGHIAGLKPAEPDFGESASGEEPGPAGEDLPEPAFDLETFDFDTANYSAGETPGEESGETENLFDLGDETFDFGSEQNVEGMAEGEAGELEPEEPRPGEGVIFEAPPADLSPEDAGASAFELPDLDENIFEEGPAAEAGAGPDFDEEDSGLPAPDEGDFSFEAAEPARDTAQAVDEQPFVEDETSTGDSSDEFSFNLEEDDISGLDFEEPAATAAGASGETAVSEEEEFALPDQAEDTSFSAPDESELARQAAALEEVPEEEGAGDLDVDEFNLGDFGAEFGLLEKAAPVAESEEDLNPAISIAAPVPGAAGGPPGEISLSEKEFEAVRKTLQRLPLNLKIRVEEIIGEGKGSHEQLERLIHMLAASAAVQDIASLAGRILGKRIPIPRGYEKRSGVAFEEERRSLAYQFRENILPILRVFLLAIVVLAVFIFFGYRFVYRPLYAGSLYERGYREIPLAAYPEANNLFARAFDVWPMKEWFYRYAQAFAANHQYLLAESKYDQLLKAYPFDKKGTIDYANFESETLANYEKAQSLLKDYLDQKGNDPQILLTQGDNYMRWAEIDKTHYEDARRSYAFIIQHFGPTDMLYMRMLRYFIRTDNQVEVVRLKDFFQADKGRKVDPQIYAELGGYLLDKNLLPDVRDVLFRAMAANDRIPEVHYQLARYFQRVNDTTEEEKALKIARDLFNKEAPLDKRRLSQLIDTYGRLGQLYYDRGADIPAQEALTTGIRRYEDAKKAQLLFPDPIFGRLYSTLGDIYYYKALDYKQAFANYEQALANKYSTPELHYKVGYIYYRNGDYERSLEDFTAAAGTISTNRNLLYATANALYMNQSYYAAEGYYSDLLDRLSAARQQIQNFMVNEDPAQRSLIDFLIRTSNNLGVTLYRLYERNGRNQNYTDALVNLKDSTEEAGNLTRDPQTAARSGKVDLAYLNMRGILYPTSKFLPQIYRDIPVDMTDLFLGAGITSGVPSH